jgi:HK97 gp10 family phage protein
MAKEYVSKTAGEDNIGLNLSGFQEMIDILDKMDKEGEKVFKDALNAGGDIILKTMKRKVYQILHRKSGDLEKNIRMGKVRKFKDGSYSQVVGPTKGDISSAYYAKFSEWGTSKEPARPWIRPSMDESQGEAYEKIEQVMTDGIDKIFNGG